MNLANRQRAELQRLRALLRGQYADLAAARAERVRLGVPPSDPVRAELERTMGQIAVLGVLVGVTLASLEYRPLVAPWQGNGLNVSIRPDFAARGVNRRPPT